jgi:hypothetical protein
LGKRSDRSTAATPRFRQKKKHNLTLLATSIVSGSAVTRGQSIEYTDASSVAKRVRSGSDVDDAQDAEDEEHDAEEEDEREGVDDEEEESGCCCAPSSCSA